MPLKKLLLRGGVDIEKTNTLNEGGISDSNLIRFFNGLAEKLGGWVQYLISPPYVGTCRALFAWSDFNGNPYLAIGTEQRLAVTSGGILGDITPLRATDNIAMDFSTTAGSQVVTVVDAITTAGAGDWINIIDAVSVGGIVLQGFYLVQSIVSGTTYTIQAAAPATTLVNHGGAVPVFATTIGTATVRRTLNNHGLALGDAFTVPVSTTVATIVLSGTYTVTNVVDANRVDFVATGLASATTTGAENGGNVQIQYLIASGQAVNVASGGWGGGDWGAGDWGGANSSVILGLRLWSLDHWGQDLIASPMNGAIYSWSPPAVIPAAIVPNAPIANILVFGIAQAQILVALGAETGGQQFPTLVRWSDSGDRTAWVASATNQAGSFQLPSGSTIVAGIAVGLGALIWTDVGLWSMVYQGLPFVFGFNRIGVNCEAISMRAPVVVGNSVVWPSDRGFFRYDGGAIAPLDCTVWSWMFDNFDDSQTEQIFGALNTLYDEVAWHFPIDPSSPIYDPAAPIGYVKWNYAENLWDKGQSSQYQRTAWTDHSPVGNPIGADTAGLLMQHEEGHNANGAPMVWFFLSGNFWLGEAGDYMRVDRLEPDFHQHIREAGDPEPITKLTVIGRDFAEDPGTAYGPFAVNSSAPMVNMNLRNKLVALQVGGDTLGGHQRMGAVIARVAPAGRR